MIDPLEWFKKFGWPVYFWVRQIAHFLGGVLIGVVAWQTERWLGLWPWVVCGSLLAGVILYKEIKEREQGQDFVKSAIDLIAWFFGFWLMFSMFGV